MQGRMWYLRSPTKKFVFIWMLTLNGKSLICISSYLPIAVDRKQSGIVRRPYAYLKMQIENHSSFYKHKWRRIHPMLCNCSKNNNINNNNSSSNSSVHDSKDKFQLNFPNPTPIPVLLIKVLPVYKTSANCILLLINSHPDCFWPMISNPETQTCIEYKVR